MTLSIPTFVRIPLLGMSNFRRMPLFPSNEISGEIDYLPLESRIGWKPSISRRWARQPRKGPRSGYDHMCGLCVDRPAPVTVKAMGNFSAAFIVV
jgi:hypothetical protein